MIATANICDLMASEAQAEIEDAQLATDIDSAIARAAVPRIVYRDGQYSLLIAGRPYGLVQVAVCAEQGGEVLWGCYLVAGFIRPIELSRDPAVDWLDAMLTWDHEAINEADYKLHPHELPDAREAEMDWAWDAAKDARL